MTFNVTFDLHNSDLEALKKQYPNVWRVILAENLKNTAKVSIINDDLIKNDTQAVEILTNLGIYSIINYGQNSN